MSVVCSQAMYKVVKHEADDMVSKNAIVTWRQYIISLYYPPNQRSVQWLFVLVCDVMC